jgi:hypothetical protein
VPTKKKMYKGDDLTKTSQDRKRSGSKYEPWENKGKKKSSSSRRSKSSSRSR